MRLSRSLLCAKPARKASDVSTLFRLWPTFDAASFKVSSLIGSYTSTIAKYPELGPAYAGRAQCLVREGQFEKALQDITRAIELTKDEQLRSYYSVIMARCHQGVACVMACREDNGAATEAELTKARADALEQLKKAANASDWASNIVLGESILESDPVAAEYHFSNAIKTLELEISSRQSSDEALLCPNATPEVSLFVRSWLAGVDYGCNQTEKSFETDTIRKAYTAYLADLNGPVGLKEYASSNGLGKLSEDETEAVIRVLALSQVHDNGFSRPLQVNIQPHKDWDGDAAVALQERMEQFSANVTRKNSSDLSRIIRKINALPKGSECYDIAEAKEVLKGAKGADALSVLVSAMGEPTTAAIRTEDAAFVGLLNDIDTTYKRIPTGVPGSDQYLTEQKRLAIDLMLQQIDRAKLGLAVAKAQQGNEEAAMEILNDIVDRDAYFRMHQVFSARAAVSKAMGNVEQADRDFREVHRLRVSTTDIPTFDANRYRNDF
eukprot:PhM_4_TR14364/c0_g1_i1/m.41728